MTKILALRSHCSFFFSFSLHLGTDFVWYVLKDESVYVDVRVPRYLIRHTVTT